MTCMPGNETQICKMKEEGGYGVRRLQDINTAAGFKLD